MPLYEYECPEHGKFEELVPMSQHREDNICPKCRQVAQRVMSACTFAIDWNSVMKKMTPEEAPNDAGYHPKWDKFTP